MSRSCRILSYRIMSAAMTMRQKNASLITIVHGRQRYHDQCNCDGCADESCSNNNKAGTVFAVYNRSNENNGACNISCPLAWDRCGDSLAQQNTRFRDRKVERSCLLRFGWSSRRMATDCSEAIENVISAINLRLWHPILVACRRCVCPADAAMRLLRQHFRPFHIVRAPSARLIVGFGTYPAICPRTDSLP